MLMTTLGYQHFCREFKTSGRKGLITQMNKRRRPRKPSNAHLMSIELIRAITKTSILIKFDGK
jgi:hypothetical protein